MTSLFSITCSGCVLNLTQERIEWGGALFSFGGLSKPGCLRCYSSGCFYWSREVTALPITGIEMLNHCYVLFFVFVICEAGKCTMIHMKKPDKGNNNQVSLIIKYGSFLYQLIRYSSVYFVARVQHCCTSCPTMLHFFGGLLGDGREIIV